MHGRPFQAFPFVMLLYHTQCDVFVDIAWTDLGCVCFFIAANKELFSLKKLFSVSNQM